MDQNIKEKKPQGSRKKLFLRALIISVGFFVLPIFFGESFAQSLDKIEKVFTRIGKSLIFKEERMWQVASDATTGEKFPGAGESVSESPWSDDNWINTEDTLASVIADTYDRRDQTYVLKLTGFDFSAIPDNAAIDGVTVKINAWYANASVSMDLCQLLTTSKVKDGINLCETKVALTTNNATIIEKGGVSDTWGNSLTPAWVKDPDFGVAIGMYANSNDADVHVGYVTVEVSYTVPDTNTLPVVELNTPADTATISDVILNFTGTDAEDDDVEYNVQIDIANSFDSQSGLPLLDKFSFLPDLGFTAGHPFASGTSTDYTVQEEDALTGGETYYWRVRGMNTLENNIYCWGYEGYGKLGDGQELAANVLTPVQVLKGEAVAADTDGTYLVNIGSVSPGYNGTCAISSGGNPYCWGDGNSGELGNNQSGNSSVPVRALKGEAVAADTDGTYLNNIKTISSVANYTCALSNEGNPYCWGSPGGGELGDGQDTTERWTPVRVHSGEAVAADTDGTYLTNIGSFWAGWNNSCAFSNEGNFYCWGAGAQGELGNNGTEDSFVPVRVLDGAATTADTDGTYLTNIGSFKIGIHHACAVSNGGNPYCWGDGAFGQLGDGQNATDRLTPVRVLKGEAVAADTDGTYLNNIKSISTDDAYHTCAVSNGGNPYCWGRADLGQLGNNGTATSTVPVRVLKGEAVAADTDGTYLINVKSINAGTWHSCAVSDAGNTYCWGNPTNGQLGDGQIVTVPLTPVRVLDGAATTADTDGTYLNNIGSIHAAYNHTCAISDDSYVYGDWSTTRSFTLGYPIIDQSSYRWKNDDGGEGVPSDWYDPDWSYRKAITVNHTKVADNLTDFPLLVSLPWDRDLSDNAQLDGEDILFTKADGKTKLNHELEKYSYSNGIMLSWVQTDLSSTEDTLIYMYYGNPTASAQENATSTWSADYRLVHHLEEENGSGAFILDSTNNANNITPLSPYYAADSWIAGGRAFNGSSDYLLAPDKDILDVTSSFTLSAWIYIWDWSDWSRIIDKRTTTAPKYGYDLILGDSTNKFLRFELTDTWNVEMVADTANNALELRKWMYVTAVKDIAANNMKVYVNAVTSGTPPTVTRNAVANTRDLYIGAENGGGWGYFNGTMDEIRISSVAKTANWITTEYNNQSATSTSFLSAGSSESSGGASWREDENTSTTIGKNENVRLRFSVKNTGGTATDYNYRLQYSTLSAASCGLEPTANFADVSTSTGAVIMATSTNVSDDEATIRQLTAPDALTFSIGRIATYSSNQTNGITLNENYFTEVEYVLKFTSSASSGTNYCFRVNVAGEDLDSYTEVATAQVIAPATNETEYRWRDDDGEEVGTLITKQHTGYTMVKPIMPTANDRFIARGKGSSWGNPLGEIEIWRADSGWNLSTQLTTSSIPVGDFYTASFPDQLGTSTLVIFGSENVEDTAFISTYNVNTDTWVWSSTTGQTSDAIYLTDVVWVSGDSSFYIIPHSFDTPLNYVWKSSVANLLIPANWTQVSLPAYSYSQLEMRMTYFKNDLYFLRGDKQYNGDLIKLTLGGASSTVFSFSSSDREYLNLYPYIDSDSNYLMVTVPSTTPSEHYDVKYSTDGSSFTALPSAPIFLTMGSHNESQAYAFPPDANNRFVVIDSVDGDDENNYIASYYLDGTLHEKITGFKSHYTERQRIVDGDYIVQGGEIALDVATYSELKLYKSDGATWLADTNVATTTGKNENIRLRFSVKNTGGVATGYNYRLQYSTLSAASCELESTGNFADVPTTSGSPVIMAESIYILNADASTRQLSVPAGLTWSAGRIIAHSSNQTDAFTLNQDSFTELEYVFKFTDYAVKSTDYCFRLKNGATAVLDSYTKVAKITTEDWGATAPTVSGTVYTDEGVTNIGGGKTVRVKVNGLGSFATTTESDGSYYINTVEVASAGDVITVYLDNETENAVTITKANDTTSNITGLDLYQDRIITRHENAGPLTIDDLDQYDQAEDDDIPFTASSAPDTLTADSTSELFVWTGKTFSTGGGGGAISLADVDINGTFTATSTQTISVSGNWDVTGGTFNGASSTVEFTSTVGGKLITVNNNPFWNLTFNGSGGGWNMADNSTTTNDLTVTAGTVTGNVNMVILGGDVTGNGTLNFIGGTFTLDGTGNFQGSNDWTFYNLNLGDGTGVATTTKVGSATTTVSNTLTVASNQILKAGSSIWNLSGADNVNSPFIINGTFVSDTSTFKYTTSADTRIKATTYYNLMLINTIMNDTYPNLIENFGFETDAVNTNPPTRWENVNDPGNVTRGVANDQKHSGTKSWKVSTTDAGTADVVLSQNENTRIANSVVPVISGLTYRISSYIKTALTTGQAHTHSALFKSGYADSLEYSASQITANTDWILNTTDIVIPADYMFMEVLLAAGAWGDTFNGNIWFDDVSVVNLSNPLESLNALTDNFDDNSINAGKWITYAGGNIVEDNQQLELTLPAHSQYNAQEFQSVKNYDLTESYASVKVVDVGDMSGSQILFPLKFVLNDINYFQVYIDSTNIVGLQPIINDSWGDYGLIEYDPNTMVYFRVRENAGYIYADYSADAISWTNFGSGVDPFPVDNLNVKMALTSDTDDAVGFTSLLDDFNIYGPIYTLGTESGQNLTVNNNLTIGNGNSPVTVLASTTNPVLDVGGNFILSTSSIFSAPTSSLFTIAGNWNNLGTFIHSNGTTTFDGTAQQILSGDMVADSAFYGLNITNNSGTNPDSSPSLIFGGAASSTNLYITTPSVKLRFTASTDYTFTNFYLNGQDTGTRVQLRSSIPDTAWKLFVSGTQSVLNTDAKDSDASGGDEIDATNSSDFNSGGNTNWDFGEESLSFSLSDNTIGFYPLSSGSVRFATGDGSLSTVDTVAHTLTASTTASYGYTITVRGATLTSGSNTITAIGGTAATSTPGNEQFGIRVEAAGGSGTVASLYNDASDFAYNATALTTDAIASCNTASADTVYSFHYMGNIASDTEAGEYSTNLTYVITANF